MKKWTYLVSGVVIGALVATAGSAFADQVKSLVGKKVTGEYTVVINGKTLQDKGAVIDGRTNVPVRGISDALGADFKVEGKKIIVTTTEGEDLVSTESPNTTKPTSTNKFIGQPKASLENSKYIVENHILKPTLKGREEILKEIEVLKESQKKFPNGESSSLTEKEKQLAEYDRMIEENTKELELINEALAALEKK
ncbi:stalk domain-containing protein [Paenibacillus dendritiformis]|uniref:stalk domain-containing protein n=1 Tax=Paenibacillus dendritiformis TaxID=130049 RepID=UPI003655CE6B